MPIGDEHEGYCYGDGVGVDRRMGDASYRPFDDARKDGLAQPA
jgi:hypothetical protein